MLDLLTIGDCTIDLFLKISDKEVLEDFDKKGRPEICFIHGTKIPVNHFETSVAGNAFNITVGCQKLGVNAGIYTELGGDSNAALIVDELKHLEIDTKYCVTNKDSPTNVSSIIVYGGDRTIFSYHEKRNYKVLDWKKPKWIYYTSQGEGYKEYLPKLVEYLNSESEIGVAFNPGTLHMKTGLDDIKDLLKITDIFFVNVEEAQKIVGDKNGEQLHKELQKLGPKLTVITNGKEGASGHDGKDYIEIKAYSNEKPLVDKTGAGDAFASGFLSAIIHKKKLEEALKWGVINAGCVIKEIGATKGLCTRKEIQNLVSSSKLAL